MSIYSIGISRVPGICVIRGVCIRGSGVIEGRIMRAKSKSEKIETEAAKLVVARDTAALNLLLQKNADVLHPRKGFELATEAVALARKSGNPDEEAAALGIKADFAYNLGDLGVALQSYKNAIALKKKTGEDLVYASMVSSLGNLYNFLGSYKDAYEHHLEALKIRSDLKDDDGIASSSNNLGTVYMKLKTLGKAGEKFEAALKTWEKTDNRKGVLKALNNLGAVYFELKDYEKSMAFCRRSLSMLEGSGEKQTIGILLNNIAMCHLKVKNLAHAEEYLKRALKLQRELGGRYSITKSLINLGEVNIRQFRIDEAIQCLRESLEIARDIDVDELAAKACLQLSEAHSQRRDYRKAYEFFVLHADYKDSIQSEDMRKRLVEMQVLHETKTKEKETEIYRLKNIELVESNKQLSEALAEVKQLGGLIPICAHCKRIKDDEGYWHQVEQYIRDRSEAEFSHTLCRVCMKELYPDQYRRMESSRKPPT